MLGWGKGSTFLHQFLALWSAWTNLRGRPWRPEVSHFRSVSWDRCSLDRMNEIGLPCHWPTKGLASDSETDSLISASCTCSSSSKECSSKVSWVASHVATVAKLPAPGTFNTLFSPASQTKVSSLLTVTNLNSMWRVPCPCSNSKSHTHPFWVQFKGTLLVQEPNSLVDPRMTTWSPNWTWWSNRTCKRTLFFRDLFFPCSCSCSCSWSWSSLVWVWGEEETAEISGGNRRWRGRRWGGGGGIDGRRNLKWLLGLCCLFREGQRWMEDA